jgi:DNA-binding MarR family transcriptional regulator
MKPQDVVVLAKLLSYKKKGVSWSQAGLAKELCLSPSQVNYALKRLSQSQLLAPVLSEENNETKLVPVTRACEEFFIHAVKYAFPPEFGSQCSGLPTAYAASPLNEVIVSGNDLPPVWPAIGKGAVRGIELKPLYHCVAKSIMKFPDQYFYELLALIDAIRLGRAREKSIGAERITEMIITNKWLKNQKVIDEN